jgi:hypothetical protein
METGELLHRFIERHQVIEAFAPAEEYATAGVITTEYAKILGIQRDK